MNRGFFRAFSFALLTLAANLPRPFAGTPFAFGPSALVAQVSRPDVSSARGFDPGASGAQTARTFDPDERPGQASAPRMPRTSASADAPDGIWWGFGVGAGALRFTCDLCTPDHDQGPTVFLMIGAHATDQLRVALEGGGWTRDDGGVRETVYRAGLTGLLYPRPGSGLHLLGGVSWVGYRADQIGYDAAGLSVGVGWDLPLLPDWAIGNAVRVETASFGSLRNERTTIADDVGLSLVRIEVTLKRR